MAGTVIWGHSPIIRILIEYIFSKTFEVQCAMTNQNLFMKLI
jgi:hypothetical protein